MSGERLHTIAGGRKGTEDRHVGHTAHVICMSISSDGIYLATGDMNKLIMIWEAATCKHLYKFTGHRGPVSVKYTPFHTFPYIHFFHLLLFLLSHPFIFTFTNGAISPPQGLSFRRGTHDLYSASHDRSIKVWNVDENAYVETL